MFIVKYYYRDNFLGEENFTNLEKAEDSLYQSAYSRQADFYEILDSSTNKIVQEFVIPSFELSDHENSGRNSILENNSLDLLDWPDDDL